MPVIWANKAERMFEAMAGLEGLCAGLAKSHQEHDRVVEAILRGDGAARHMRAHIATVRAEYEAYVEQLSEQRPP